MNHDWPRDVNYASLTSTAEVVPLRGSHRVFDCLFQNKSFIIQALDNKSNFKSNSKTPGAHLFKHKGSRLANCFAVIAPGANFILPWNQFSVSTAFKAVYRLKHVLAIVYFFLFRTHRCGAYPRRSFWSSNCWCISASFLGIQIEWNFFGWEQYGQQYGQEYDGRQTNIKTLDSRGQLVKLIGLYDSETIVYIHQQGNYPPAKCSQMRRILTPQKRIR